MINKKTRFIDLFYTETNMINIEVTFFDFSIECFIQNKDDERFEI